MKKLLIPILVGVLIIGAGGASYKYFNGPKITESSITKSIDDNGKATAPSTTFKPKDTVYFSAKGKKLAIKKATVVWYKGEVATKNRFKVDENIEINKSGYFTSTLSAPEGLEEGQYGVTIYSAGKEIMEGIWNFDVKN
ncbi:hypothetical protein [Clostridium beijerinckii]|uniref:hypothetical protein n=1 Tax=Clostridium beijerinckii TaxID=1520 RepID=UPI00047A351D|nr:hypothetical protein [Clostridium beijerinckii]